MSENPLVSTVVIFLNAQKFIGEAVESVFAQSYKHWELILVDDGSTDNSSAIARDYAEHNSGRVRYLEHAGHSNRGKSASRNLGMRHASGDFVATLDSDDVWMPRKLEQQVSLLLQHPDAELVYGHTLLWNRWSGAPANSDPDEVYPLGLRPDRVYRPPVLLEMLVKQRMPPPSISNVCFRRRVFDQIGGFQEEFGDMYEDQTFLAKVFLHASVFVSKECWDKYRQHEGSCVSHATLHGLWEQSLHKYLSWLVEYLIEEGFQGTTTWKAVQLARWLLRHPKMARAYNIGNAVRRRTLGLLYPPARAGLINTLAQKRVCP